MDISHNSSNAPSISSCTSCTTCCIDNEHNPQDQIIKLATQQIYPQIALHHKAWKDLSDGIEEEMMEIDDDVANDNHGSTSR